MHVRLIFERDRAAVIELARQMTELYRPDLTFDPVRADALVTASIKQAHPTIFVADDDGDIVGGLAAYIVDYPTAAGFFVSQELFYVRPDKRGTRAAALLFAEFNRWADRLDPEEVFAGTATGHRPEVAARWMRRFGFETLGAHMRRRVRR